LDFQKTYFPIKDDEKVKKLRHEIEHILGVYIDFDAIQKNETKDKLALIHFVDIIMSCEARLKLEWISGQEGISE
jgi:hypothetical protein